MGRSLPQIYFVIFLQRTADHKTFWRLPLEYNGPKVLVSILDVSQVWIHFGLVILRFATKKPELLRFFSDMQCRCRWWIGRRSQGSYS